MHHAVTPKVCVETYVVHVKVLGVTGSSVLLVSGDVELVSSLDRDLSSAPPTILRVK